LYILYSSDNMPSSNTAIRHCLLANFERDRRVRWFFHVAKIRRDMPRFFRAGAQQEHSRGAGANSGTEQEQNISRSIAST
jgi:hypothetical protein